LLVVIDHIKHHIIRDFFYIINNSNYMIVNYAYSLGHHVELFSARNYKPFIKII